MTIAAGAGYLDRHMSRKPLSIAKIGFCLAATFALVAACGGAKYPNCDNDDDCNTDGHKGVCVNTKCVQCKDDSGCATGQKCESGACNAIQGYCDEKSKCPGGAPCSNNRCAPPVTVAVECSDDKPCAAGQRCENGHCVAPVNAGPECSNFDPPLFDFESPQLRDASTKTMQRLAGCLSSGALKGRRVLLTGHCDDRGEYEFNMGLGAQRAEAVKGVLTSAGIAADRVATSSRGKLDATGKDEAGYEHDRRVDIEIR
ncbi:MAG: OmpA family protein [Polyangiaceae bacterium]